MSDLHFKVLYEEEQELRRAAMDLNEQLEVEIERLTGERDSASAYADSKADLINELKAHVAELERDLRQACRIIDLNPRVAVGDNDRRWAQGCVRRLDAAHPDTEVGIVSCSICGEQMSGPELAVHCCGETP